MDHIIYTRQQNLGIAPPTEVSIVGCGGVGAWVAIDLAMAGTYCFNLFDNDYVEAHNLNRVPFGLSDVGKSKTLVLKRFIKKIRSNTRVYRFGNLTEITLKLLMGSVVVDCTDKLSAQTMIYKECVSKGLRYYRVGYDGNHLGVIDASHPDAPKLDKVWGDGSGRSGYTIVDSWIVPPQIAAAFVTEIICKRISRPPINTHVDDLIRKR